MSRAAKRFVIHEEGCPALCKLRIRILDEPGRYCAHNSHIHACTAPTPEQLRELVEAAKIAEGYIGVLDSGMAHQIGVRLLDALAPFLPEQKEEPIAKP